MPSTFTQNLGVELPATGEQANIWGSTVNRNMATIDLAINGNTQILIGSNPPYQLTVADGVTLPQGATPLIMWTGPQTALGVVHIDWQSTRQHLYIMKNQTTGGYAINFQQGNGSLFSLQAGYDAIIYSDGGGTNANVGAAVASPQFTNILATGNLQVNGSINGILTTDTNGNVLLSGGLGVGGPAAIPDPVTINGLGYGQLRLVEGNYGVFFRNDGSALYLMITASGTPYGNAAGLWPLGIDLASRCVGLAGYAPTSAFGLNVPSIHSVTLSLDGGLTVGGGITGAGGLSISGARTTLSSAAGDPFILGLQNGSLLTYVGTNSAGQFMVANSGGSALMTVDPAAGAVSIAGPLTMGGQLSVPAAGIRFYDGSVQTTAISNNFPGNITVNGVVYGNPNVQQAGTLYCFPFNGTYPHAPPHTVLFSHNEADSYVTIYVTRSDGTRWLANINLVESLGPQP